MRNSSESTSRVSMGPEATVIEEGTPKAIEIRKELDKKKREEEKGTQGTVENSNFATTTTDSEGNFKFKLINGKKISEIFDEATADIFDKDNKAAFFFFKNYDESSKKFSTENDSGLSKAKIGEQISEIYSENYDASKPTAYAGFKVIRLDDNDTPTSFAASTSIINIVTRSLGEKDAPRIQLSPSLFVELRLNSDGEVNFDDSNFLTSSGMNNNKLFNAKSDPNDEGIFNNDEDILKVLYKIKEINVNGKGILNSLREKVEQRINMEEKIDKKEEGGLGACKTGDSSESLAYASKCGNASKENSCNVGGVIL